MPGRGVVVRELLDERDEHGGERGAGDRAEAADHDDDERVDQQAACRAAGRRCRSRAPASTPASAAASPPIAKTSVNARRTSIPSAVTIARFSTPARTISP